MNESTSRNGGLILLGVFLAVGLVAASFVVSGAMERIKRAGDTITVKGYAEVRVTSDTASWAGNLVARARTLPEAYAIIERSTARTTAFLTSQGIGVDQITAEPVNVMPRYRVTERGQSTGEVASYELNRQVRIAGGNVAAIASAARKVTDLVREGVEIMSFSPQYFVSDLDKVKLDLLGAATRDARQRAEMFAANSGVRVGGLKDAQQGVFQITTPNSVEVAGYGMYDTSTIDKSVKAVITARFFIE